MVTIDVWSDVLCPFCYIGKRHLEAALGQFEHRGDVRVVWKSFQLDPHAAREATLSNAERLARKYGRTVEWAARMTEQVSQRGAQVGLRFDFTRAIPTNSFDALRLIHLARARSLEDAAEERLFAAHFTEGLNVGDLKVLQVLGVEIGLDADEVARLLAGDAYADDVHRDTEAARTLGVTGVPFFLLNRRYAVSGAQPVTVFLEALQTAWANPQPASGALVPTTQR